MKKGLSDLSRKGQLDFKNLLEESGSDEAVSDEVVKTPGTVTEVTRTIKTVIEGYVGRVWVEGEISNFSAPRSGHYYFTLKDNNCSIGCVMWRSNTGKVDFTPEDGLHVEVRGKVTVYEPQGRYQIVCDSLKSVREGSLLQQFEEMKAHLQAEGLFSPEYKKILPPFPKCVGIATSATGAAVRDIIRVLRRRMPSIEIIVSPCKVQGEGAKADIVKAVNSLDRSGYCDVIIVGRGGGSLEDLWAFNEEEVARAIFNLQTPVISAVGHETDFSISDLVADIRAATPSEAAEIVVSDFSTFEDTVREYFARLNNSLKRNIQLWRSELRNLSMRPVLRDPLTMVMLKAQKVDELTERLARAEDYVLNEFEDKISLLAAKLQSLSPLNVMARGYSVTWLREKRKLVRNTSQVTIDDMLETKLAKGTVLSRVMEIIPEED